MLDSTSPERAGPSRREHDILHAGDPRPPIAATTVNTFGDFSTIDFTMNGFGEPRTIKAGVVNGSYFDVMGLRPVLGRLLSAADDGPPRRARVLLHSNGVSRVRRSSSAALSRRRARGEGP